MEDKKTNKRETVGTFLSFVLLSDFSWDKDKFIKDMKKKWRIYLHDEKDDPDTLISVINRSKLVVGYMKNPVPYSEVVECAGKNYIWEDAEDVAKNHKAQIIIYLEGEDDIIQKGILFTKAVYCALFQKDAVAVYMENTVLEKQNYQDFADMFLKNGQIPILNLIWLGINKYKSTTGLYTQGMKKFAKKEIEIYDRNFDFVKIRDFLLDIIDYVLVNDISFKDGETIGFTDEQKIPVKITKGIAIDSDTVKIVVDDGALL